jgi:hypothetical protein
VGSLSNKMDIFEILQSKKIQIYHDNSRKPRMYRPYLGNQSNDPSEWMLCSILGKLLFDPVHRSRYTANTPDNRAKSFDPGAMWAISSAG